MNAESMKLMVALVALVAAGPWLGACSSGSGGGSEDADAVASSDADPPGDSAIGGDEITDGTAGSDGSPGSDATAGEETTDDAGPLSDVPPTQDDGAATTDAVAEDAVLPPQDAGAQEVGPDPGHDAADATKTPDGVADSAAPEDITGTADVGPTSDASPNEDGSTSDVAVEEDVDVEPGCPGECCDVIDCLGGALEPTCCSVVICEDFTCKLAPLADCCEVDDNCDDASPATIDTCATPCTIGGCSFDEPPCQSLDKLAEGFDDGTLGTLQSGNGAWITAQSLEAATGGFSAYFGDAACQTYFDGPIGDDCELPPLSTPQNTGALNLVLSSPDLVLTPETNTWLGFWLNMAAEPGITLDLGDGPQVFGTDFLSVIVKPAAGQELVWRSVDESALGEPNTTNGAWVYQAVDLSAFAGQTISIEFVFTADTSANFNEDPNGPAWYGVYLDQVQVTEACAGDLCAPGSSCPADGDGCTSDACTPLGSTGGGVCAYPTASPGADCNVCQKNADCDDGDPCFSDVCSNGACVHTYTGACCEPSSGFPFATAEGETATEDFEGGALVGWTIDDDHPDNVTWQVHGGMAHSGAASLYFGDPATGTYQASPPGAAAATAWTDAFEVPGDAFHTSVVSFWLWLSTEFDGLPPASPENLLFDRLDVLLDQGPAFGPPAVVWSSADELNNTTDGAWVQVGVDVSTYAGQVVQLGLRFDSVDGSVNGFAGVYVDELSVSAVCGLECLGSNDCEDANLCDEEACELGECVTISTLDDCCSSNAQCNDGYPCTSDVCTAGVCSNTLNPACCTQAAWPGEWSEDFAGGLGDWTTEDNTPPVVWHGSGGAAVFHDPATGTYANPAGGDSQGLLISPVIEVPGLAGTHLVEFDVLLETEWDGADPGDFIEAFVIDELMLHVAVDGAIAGATEVWSSQYMYNTTAGQTIGVAADLSAFAGEAVQLVFEFDSGDGAVNGFAGPTVDNVAFQTKCQAPQCLIDTDCSSADPCVAMSCVDLSCQGTPITTGACCEPAIDASKTWGFEAGPAGWFNTPCGGPNDDPTVVWQTFKPPANYPAQPFGTGLLTFSNFTDYGGINGKSSCDEIESPCFELEAGSPWEMSMMTFIDVEPPPGCAGAGAPFADVFFFTLEDCDSSASEILLMKDDVQCAEYNTWFESTFDLTSWAGKSVRLRFAFDSFDEFENSGLGIAVDRIEFQQGCP